MEEAATPFPSEETTPPVTKIYFGAIHVARVLMPGLSALHRSDVRTIMAATCQTVKSNSSHPDKRFFFFPIFQRNFFHGNGFESCGEYSMAVDHVLLRKNFCVAIRNQH